MKNCGIFSSRWTFSIGAVFIAILALTPDIYGKNHQPAGPEHPVWECNQVVKPGDARGFIKVWTWNNTAGECQEIAIGGDEPDTNIYGDKKDCMDKCGPSEKAGRGAYHVGGKKSRKGH